MDNHIYFSPHLDDAVFSCGSLIHKQISDGDSVTVVNFFAGIPTVRLTELSKGIRQFIYDSGFKDLLSFYNFRRDEDSNALSELGSNKITRLNLDFLESIYRKDVKGELLYKTFSDVFSFNVHKEDISPAFFFDLINSIVNNLSPEPFLYFPLPIAGHVDHMIIKDLGNLFHKKYKNVFFYEDIYTIDHNVEEYIANHDKNMKVTVLRKVSEKDIAAHVVGMKSYVSQIDRMEDYTKIKTREMVEILNTRTAKNTFRLWKY